MQGRSIKKWLYTATLIVGIGALTGCTGTRYSRTAGQFIDDEVLEARVGRELNRDSMLEGADIEAKAFRGHVQLTGFVAHPEQKQRASEIARYVRGVDYFKNNLVVKSQLPALTAGTGTNPAAEAAGAGQQRQGQQQFRAGAQTEEAGWERGFFWNGEVREGAGAELEIEAEAGQDQEGELREQQRENRQELQEERQELQQERQQQQQQ